MKQLKDFSLEGANNDIEDNDLLNGVVGKYKNKSEDELVAELIKAVRTAKDDGSFNEESIEEFIDLVSPHLNDEQKQKLNSLISVIKLED